MSIALVRRLERDSSFVRIDRTYLIDTQEAEKVLGNLSNPGSESKAMHVHDWLAHLPSQVQKWRENV